MHPYTAYTRLHYYYFAYNPFAIGVVDSLFCLLYNKHGGPISGLGYISSNDYILLQFAENEDDVTVFGSGRYVDSLNFSITDAHWPIAIANARERIVTANRGYDINGTKFHGPPGSIIDDPVVFETQLLDYLAITKPKYECLFGRLDIQITDDRFTYESFMRDWHYTDLVCTRERRASNMRSQIMWLMSEIEMFGRPYELADDDTPRIIIQTIAEYLRSLIDYLVDININLQEALDMFREDLHKMNQLLE